MNKTDTKKNLKNLGELGFLSFLNSEQPKPEDALIASTNTLYMGKDSSIYIRQKSGPNFFTPKLCFIKYISTCDVSQTLSNMTFTVPQSEISLKNTGNNYIDFDSDDTTRQTIKIYSSLKETFWKMTFRRGALKMREIAEDFSISLNVILNDAKIANFQFDYKQQKISPSDTFCVYFTAAKDAVSRIQIQYTGTNVGVLGIVDNPNIIIFEQMT